MTDLPARTTRRSADTAPAVADRAVATPLPAPQYAGLFIEPDLPPAADEPE
ncbi:hypothetical protein [Streptomyces sp. NPDC059166]|uniref:hypothetical protein n=1 Tax=Streptomyces sp. NPDC059166 TaxID=3346752 RepID=UPI00368AA712